MKSTKFEREVKSLLYFIRTYGIQHTSVPVEEIFHNDDIKNQFVHNVHTGFYLAQKNVVRLLTKVLTERKKLKTELKLTRQNKIKDRVNEINNALSENKYQEMTLRKIVDAIAWQLFNCDITIIRRLYGGEELIDITDSNLESELHAIEKFLEKDPDCFVLINDLTTFIQVGDVIVYHPDRGLEIYELKEGEKNGQVIELINRVMNEEVCVINELSEHDEKFIEHLKRTAKQFAKESSVINTINTGKGKDLYTGMETTISQTVIEMDCYDEQLGNLIEKCYKSKHAIDVIEDILLLGVYKENEFPSVVFEDWKKACDIRIPTYDLRYSMLDPMAQPIFLLNFSDKVILDILMGRITVKMALDVNGWLETFKEDGYEYCWMSKKQTARQAIPHVGNPVFQLDGCGVLVKNQQGKSIMLAYGIFMRMYVLLNLPSSARKYIEKVLEETQIQTETN